MAIKYLGAALIFCGCTAGGFFLAGTHRLAEFCLEELIRALDFMCADLSFRASSLPELLSRAGNAVRGPISRVFQSLGRELSRQIWERPEDCMNRILEQVRSLPENVTNHLRELGQCLGHFHLDGQIRQLQQVRSHCDYTLETLRKGREQRLRSYQTLGICAGAALAIVLL